MNRIAGKCRYRRLLFEMLERQTKRTRNQGGGSGCGGRSIITRSITGKNLEAGRSLAFGN